jgi:DNA repair protein SbcD/Mre11
LPVHFNVGVLHTALQGGCGEHANYAPCTLDELHAKGYDDWALGHVPEHKLWAGRSTICFPGNLQGRGIRETGRRGAVMVTVAAGRPPQVERLYLDVLRCEHVAVDLSACDNHRLRQSSVHSSRFNSSRALASTNARCSFARNTSGGGNCSQYSAT